MAQDFAKRKPNTGAKKASGQKAQARRTSSESQSHGKGFRLYLAGVLTGVFLSFLGYLGTLPDPVDPNKDGSTAQPAVEVPKPRFEFYTLLPKQTLDGEELETVEPAADVSKPPAVAVPEPYLLQAGSFRQKDDAERRRAELLLLGLEPKLEETSGDSGRWFRVHLGPFESHESMTKARGLLANQKIESVVLKRSGP
ncbi:MAG TPA: SPOR domain-containing protein [Halioglobus sp.]